METEKTAIAPGLELVELIGRLRRAILAPSGEKVDAEFEELFPTPYGLAVSFWIEASAEDFARWLARETRSWRRMQGFGGFGYFEGFKARDDRTLLRSRWGLNAPGDDDVAHPAEGYGIMVFELHPAGKRLKVAFGDRLATTPPDAPDLPNLPAGERAGALSRVKRLLMLTLASLFAEIREAWPEAGEQLRPDPDRSEAQRGAGEASPATPPIARPQRRNITGRRAKVKALWAEGLTQKKIATMIPCHRHTVGSDVAWLRAHGEIEG